MHENERQVRIQKAEKKAKEQGLAEGRAEGRKEGRIDIIRTLSKTMSVQDIATALNETTSEIEKILKK